MIQGLRIPSIAATIVSALAVGACHGAADQATDAGVLDGAAAAVSATPLGDGGPERVDMAALKGGEASAGTPLPPAHVADTYGTALWDTEKKFPALKPAILALDPAFYAQQIGPSESNTAFQLADGREVVIMSGCRNGYQCGATGYALAFDAAHKAVSFVESTPATHDFVVYGNPDPATRGLLFERAAKTLAKAAVDPANASLQGVTMLPQAGFDTGYGDPQAILTSRPDIGAAVKKVFNGFVATETDCGARLKDGREFLLISGTSTHADGFVPYGIGIDLVSKAAFAYRAQGQLGKEAWYGDPTGELRPVLSTVSEGCPNLRVKLGLDPNGRDAPACDIHKTDWANMAYAGGKVGGQLSKGKRAARGDGWSGIELATKEIRYADLNGDGSMEAYVPLDEPSLPGAGSNGGCDWMANWDGAESVYAFQLDAQCALKQLGVLDTDAWAQSSIAGNTYVVDDSYHKAGDPMCVPSGDKRTVWRFVGGKLQSTTTTVR